MLGFFPRKTEMTSISKNEQKYLLARILLSNWFYAKSHLIYE